MDRLRYLDFVIDTTEAQDATLDAKGRPSHFLLRVFDSPAGEGEEAEKVVVAGWEALMQRRDALAARALDAADLLDFGRQLGDLCLPPRARDLFLASLAELGPNTGLRIRLRLLQVLRVLPWEYALVPAAGQPAADDFLLRDPRLSIVRHEAVSVPAAEFSPGPRHRVFVGMASPKPHNQYPPLKLQSEQHCLKTALQAVPGIDVTYVPDYGPGNGHGVSLKDIAAVVGKQPIDIFHFSGHGEFVDEPAEKPGAKKGVGWVVLADEHDVAKPLSGADLSALLREGRVRLAVLDACETAEADIFQRWSGVAYALLHGRIPAVVAMQFSVYDDAGREFAREFYSALAAGQEIDQAVARGRRAAWVWDPRERDWGTPVLYLRNSGGRILPPVTDPVALQSAEASARQASVLDGVLGAWLRDRGVASAEQLEYIAREAPADVAPLDALLLLRSAIALDEPLAHWIEQLKKVQEPWLNTEAKSGQAMREEDAVLRLAAIPAQREERLAGFATVAATSPGDLVRRTAAVALYAATAGDATPRLLRALDGVQDHSLRRARRAELLGTLADVSPEIAADLPRLLEHAADRRAVWSWRAGGRFRLGMADLLRWVLGGALGAGLALAIYRGLLAMPNSRLTSGIAFAIYSYWGALLGLALAAAVAAAGPLLLESARTTRIRARKVSLAAALLAAIGFALANLVVAWMNGMPAPVALRQLPAGALVGLGIGLGLWGQPFAGRRLGWSGWLRRLAPAFILPALAQAPALCDTVVAPSGSWLASAVFEASEWISMGFAWFPPLKTAFDVCEPAAGVCCACGGAASVFTQCFEQILSILDAGLVGVVLLAGITFGMRIRLDGLRRGWGWLLSRLGYRFT